VAFNVTLYSFTCNVVQFWPRIMAICTEMPMLTSMKKKNYLTSDISRKLVQIRRSLDVPGFATVMFLISLPALKRYTILVPFEI